VARIRFGARVYRVAQVAVTAVFSLALLWVAAEWVRSHWLLAVVLGAPALAGLVYFATGRRLVRLVSGVLVAPAAFYSAYLLARSAMASVKDNPVGVAAASVIVALGICALVWVKRVHGQLHNLPDSAGEKTTAGATGHQLAIGLSSLLVAAVTAVTLLFARSFVSVLATPGLLGALACFFAVYAAALFVFGLAYATMYVPKRQSFTSPETPCLFDFMCYSFVTLFGLGTTDLKPVSPAAKFLSMIEAAFGFVGVSIYLAAIISRFVVAAR
jgi:hypothetical protein